MIDDGRRDRKTLDAKAHRLNLGRRKRVLRSLMRNIPIWMGSFSAAAFALYMDLLALISSAVEEAARFIITIPALDPRQQTLLDRLLGSHGELLTKK